MSEPFLRAVRDWAAAQPDLLAVLLVGSVARGAARPDSDIDLILICEHPERYQTDDRWLAHFGRPARVAHEDWGWVQSTRVFYEGGPEVEFGITFARWAGVEPLDEGTRRVVADGARILYDPHGLLGALLAAVRARSRHYEIKAELDN